MLTGRPGARPGSRVVPAIAMVVIAILAATAAVAVASGFSVDSHAALHGNPAAGTTGSSTSARRQVARPSTVGVAVQVKRPRGNRLRRHRHRHHSSQPGNPTPGPAPVAPAPAPRPTAPTDTVAPQTTITSKPAASTTATSANFSFSSSETGSSFECKLDSGGWVTCSSAKSYSSLAAAAHLFSVRAVDGAGNADPSPASYGWTVEPAPPASTACTTVVSSVSAAQSAVSSASAGSVICLADGTYGKLTLNAAKAVPGVTMRAEHAGAATIDGASLSGSRLTLARFNVTDEVVVQPGTTGMVVEHNLITGGYFGLDAGPTSTTQVNDVAVIDNSFVGPYGEDAIRLNRYHDADGDGQGALIEGNEFTGIRENGNHSDCLQTVWVGDHIVFRKNYLHNNRCQGFFIKDQASLGEPSGPVSGIVVEDNLLLRNTEPCGPPATSCGQPVYFHVFGPYTGLVMKRNTIWGDSSGSIAALREGVAPDTVIESNVVYRFWTDTDASKATFANNTLCSLEGTWPSSRPGTTVECAPHFGNPTVDDYRLGNGRGVDWAPAEHHYGP